MRQEKDVEAMKCLEENRCQGKDKVNGFDCAHRLQTFVPTHPSINAKIEVEWSPESTLGFKFAMRGHFFTSSASSYEYETRKR
jgi:hypothetical protein